MMSDAETVILIDDDEKTKMMSDAETVILSDDDETIENEGQELCRSREFHYRPSILHPKEEQPRQDQQPQQEGAPQQKSEQPHQQDHVFRVSELVEQLQQTQREEREHALQVRREERQCMQRMWEEERQRMKIIRLENRREIQRIHQMFQPMQEQIQQIEPMQQLVRYIEPMRKQMAEMEQMMAALRSERPASAPFRNLRPVNVLRPVNGHCDSRAPPGAQGPHVVRRRSPRYTEDEDRRMVRYLVEKNKIDRARSDDVWEEMRAEDPVIALRSVPSLKHRFRVYVWPKVMAGRYTDNLQTLRKFGGIWPERVVRAS